ncbi:MAG: hypothetical protein H6709_04145 [Kofleriaceae bacterium]|nr:hypothetical protein [Myxococcales bacterium]MCB9560176.1 hypothetical protein [Kofleriaceae bacterium]MCB9571262.1 hypothetical protein [Kofleriaceae bacterium]
MTRAVPLLAAIALVLIAGCNDHRHPRTFPQWVIGVTDPEAITWRGCAGLRAVIQRSGKAGVGVVLEARSRQTCDVVLERAELILDDGARAAADAIDLGPLPGRSLRRYWMPVRFDADAAWNRGTRRGRLELALRIGGQAQEPVTWPVSIVFPSPYLDLGVGAW